MSIDININFKADDRLLNSLDYLSGWLCTLYELRKERQPKEVLPAAGRPTLEPEERKKLNEMVGKVLDDAKEKPATSSSASPEPVQKPDASTSSEPAKKTPEIETVMPFEEQKPKEDTGFLPDEEAEDLRNRAANACAGSGFLKGTLEPILKKHNTDVSIMRSKTKKIPMALANDIEKALKEKQNAG